jgi:Arylsulfatase regulator (Fe-S oxidoreductase)
VTVHVSATTGCNLGCTYCYENPDRERSENWAKRQYDIDKIMQQLKFFKKKHPHETPGLHGGEPLLMDRDDIRRVFGWINDNYDGTPHIQTNATLVDDEIIEIFKEHNVGVGVSCDGPAELNQLRKASGEVEKKRAKVTDKMTQQTHEAIDRMIDEGISGGVIVVLSEQNAGTEEKFETLLEWMDYLCENGWERTLQSCHTL